MRRFVGITVAVFAVAACGDTITNNYLATNTVADGGTQTASDGAPQPIPTDGGATPSDGQVTQPDAGTVVTTAGITLTSCNVPYALNAAKLGDQAYLASHFSHLIQQYCITGIVRGANLAVDPEKMYYGSHATGVATLTQIAFTSGMMPTYSVKINFKPDSAMKAGSVWGAGLVETPNEAIVAVYKHLSASSQCLFGIGTGGKITVASASNMTAEGGTFNVSGNINVADPKDIQVVCDEAAGTSAPCCN
jgi:hypothetical protein